jgi:hypothetical protein
VDTHAWHLGGAQAYPLVMVCGDPNPRTTRHRVHITPTLLVLLRLWSGFFRASRPYQRHIAAWRSEDRNVRSPSELLENLGIKEGIQVPTSSKVS